MEVTKENFQELLPQITLDIDRSQFIAFDQDMTGIYKEAYKRQRRFETLEEWYLKNRKLTRGFAIIQFRLTCFDQAVVGDTKNIQYRCYNFYLQPDPVTQSARDALSYLAKNGFDFKKCYLLGIPFCNAKREEELLQAFEAKRMKRELGYSVSQQQETPVPEDLREFLADVKNQIDNFLLVHHVQELAVGPFNSYQKLFVFQLLETEERANKIEVLREEIGGDIIRLRKTPLGQDFEEEQRKHGLALIEAEIGMRRLMQKLSESKKLLVGHNMFVSLMYIVRQFFQDLPADYEAYKRLVGQLFPSLVDTKYLSSEVQGIKEFLEGTGGVRDMIFQQLHPLVVPPCVPNGDRFGIPLSTADHSELAAGSLKIGICFIGMMRQLGVNFTGLSSENPVLRPLMNRLFVNCTQFSKVAILNGHDKFQDRDLVFFAEFPIDWNRFDFDSLCKPFGPCQVVFLSEKTCFLALNWGWKQDYDKALDPFAIHPMLKLTKYGDYVRKMWE